MMKAISSSVFLMADSKSNPRVCSTFFIIAALICTSYIIGSAYLSKNFTPGLPELQMNDSSQNRRNVECDLAVVVETPKVSPDPPDQKCKAECSRPIGSETLPKGILVTTSNLNMRPLWGPVADNVCFFL
ncbi:uncharacterized protein LOC124925087 [Impatiens glandulifera]|uniref:uncharacterized protein LOC124925087 n=1 Tax=Impatiens glandulifera TaxID=253017 RepID=UPI001FB0B4EE|nr:uncharacterized protein LOC124925087 [Impatiens glandulifera]